MKRIDKIISSQGEYTRSEVKRLISRKAIKVDDKVIKSPSFKVDPNKNKIAINDVVVIHKTFVYLMLNKPKGYISATRDEEHKTVLDLVPDELRGRNLFPAGRLDKDTTGLVIITDDGVFAHNILSPKKHIQKMYNVTLDIPVNDEMVQGFSKGVKLKDGLCKPSLLTITGENTATVALSEGRNHQIKRMFGCFGAKVVELHRFAMGNLYLPEDLLEGSCRELSENEVELLQQL